MTRQILRASPVGYREVRELLEAIFVAEALAPSRCVWLVSPWVRDIEVIDNRSGGYTALEPQWGARRITLIEILHNLLERGSYIVLATRPDDEQNRNFVKRLERVAYEDPALCDRLSVCLSSQLHVKGLLGDRYCLSGSMNFTHHGIAVTEEMLTYQTEAAEVQSLRLEFQKHYGGRL